MVKNKDADAMISGYSRNYAAVIKPVLKIISKSNRGSRIAATNMMLTDSGPLFLSDTTLNIDPSDKELAKIAILNAELVKLLGFKSVIALLSFSNLSLIHISEPTRPY